MGKASTADWAELQQRMEGKTETPREAQNSAQR
jgi:hypothetical protein